MSLSKISRALERDKTNNVRRFEELIDFLPRKVTYLTFSLNAFVVFRTFYMDPDNTGNE